MGRGRCHAGAELHQKGLHGDPMLKVFSGGVCIRDLSELQILADHCWAVGRDIQSIQKTIHFVLGIDHDQQRAEAKAVLPAEEVHQSATVGTL